MIELAKEVTPLHPIVRDLFWWPAAAVLLIPIGLGVIWGRKSNASHGAFVGTVAAIVTIALVPAVARTLQVGPWIFNPVFFLVGLPALVAIAFGFVAIATAWAVRRVTTSTSDQDTEPTVL